MYSLANIILMSSVSSFLFTSILFKFQGLKIKSEYKKYIGFSLIMMNFLVIFGMNLKGVVKIVIIYLVTGILNYCILNRSLRESAIYALITYSISIISEIVSVIIFMLVLKVNISLDKISEYNIILHIMIVAVAMILLAFILMLFKKMHFNNYVKESEDDTVPLYLGINLLVIAGVWVYLVLNGDSAGKQIYNIVIIFIFFSTNIALILYQSNISVKEKLIKNIQEEKEKRDMYIDVMEDLMDNIKSFKHDYNNSMLTLSGYIDDGDYVGTRNFINMLKNSSKDEKIIQYYDLKYIKDSGLKGLIISKVSDMIREELDFAISIDKDNQISKSNIDILDLSRIIGILIDNAIEASLISEEKKILLNVLENKCSTEIVISNSFLGPIDLASLRKNGYSTKGNNRGIGLYNVETLVDKYENLNLFTSINENMFFQKIEILR